ncbi:MAG TPA: hypothetical protein VMT67_16750 [Terriglobales bacterium]|nr:hypothetical protein [Terriglobales bacterium]
MRTTLAIDEDLAVFLRKEIRKSGETFKQVVNRYIRLGMTASKQPARKPFIVRPWNLGLPDFEKTEEFLEYLEGPEHR